MNAEERERAHFLQVTAEHELTIMRDDGLWRHLRFQKPGCSFYYYDLVTWPGHLVITGDNGDYHFSRIMDMFEFFDGQRQADGINPHYWGEKLRGGASGGRELVRVYSEDALRGRLRAWAHEEAAYNEDVEMYPDLLYGAIDRLLDLKDPDFRWHELHHEHGARELLSDLEGAGITGETWEWELRDFDARFLWNCWAIRHGIRRYREVTTPST